MNDSVHIVCPHCQAINRVAQDRLGDQPKCGSCKNKLFESRPIDLTAANFDRHISKNGIPVVVDFWAAWCAPCKMMAPAFAQAVETLEPNVRFGKLNTDAESSVAARYGIRNIPTMIVFKDGKEKARQPGAMSANDIVRWIETQL
ncbi:MAG: thioredoxin TrxC [Arenicellales bacterium]|nr:thioredoxin TrxC [Arenicellales bacterium]